MVVISEKIIGLLNYRINQEEQSSRLYLSISRWLNFKGFSGAAALWKKYSNEELVHADWAVNFLLAFNIMPETQKLMAESNYFTGLKQIVALSYKHELDILNQCKELAGAALKELDFSTLELAQKFVAEQTEELDKLQYWIDRLELFGNDSSSLMLIDQEMATK